MKVFISYGSAPDQVTALRLQALGAVNGLTVYVPPAYTRQLPYASIDPEVMQQLNETDFVLGIVGFKDSPVCREELAAARVLSKQTMLMTELAAVPYFQVFNENLVVINQADPYQTELAIVEHLKKLKADKQVKKAMVALGTLALGLVIFTLAAAPED